MLSIGNVAVAACRGLVLWIILYVFVVGGLIVYKWDSVNHVQHEEVIVQKTIIEYIEPEPVEPITVYKKKEKPPVFDEEEANKTAALLRELEEVKKRQDQLLSDAARYISLIEHNTDHEPPAPKMHPTKQQQPSLTYVESLLQTPTLSDSTPDTLQDLFRNALDELRTLKSRADHIDWSVFGGIVSTRHDRVAPEPPVCTIDESANGRVTVKTNPNLARKSDLFMARDDVLSMINERVDPESLPDILATEGVIERMEEEVIGAIETVVASQESSSEVDYGSCVEEDVLMDMLEQGLVAIKTRKDLQSVLTNYVKELQPDEPALILDAQLPPPSRPYVPPRETVSLRELLNTEMLHQSATLIDIVADTIGGYNDMIDDYIDRLERQRNEGSVGKALVAQLLELAGKLRIPNPHAKIDSNAGILRQPLP